MEQEIKFRYTYRRKSDGHIYQTIYPLECIEDINGQFATMRDNKLWEVVGRDLYTGLTDKNGTEIYDGDMVKFHYFYGTLGSEMGFVEAEHELTGIVEWGAYGWGISSIEGEHWEGYTGYSKGEGESSFMDLMSMNESSIHEESFEIIGDIYTTPELINVK